MSNYIKREDVIKEIGRFVGYLDDDMICRIKIALNRLPSADVEPVKHGHWTFCGDIDSIIEHGGECSICHQSTEDNGYYCSCCGAKMDDKLQREVDPELFKNEGAKMPMKSEEVIRSCPHRAGDYFGDGWVCLASKGAKPCDELVKNGKCKTLAKLKGARA